MTTSEKQYRYPGVQPFSSAQQGVFFGRQADTERLLSLILQERLCVLFGKSGHGKSSLLNAGIVPALAERSEKGKRRFVAVPVRFNTWTGWENAQTLFERFLFHLRKALQEAGIPPGEDFPELPSTLWGAFKQWNPAQGTAFVLLFDQFEEFFSYPEEQQEAFKEQLAELLYVDYPQFLEDKEDRFSMEQTAFLAEKTDVRALLSIRQDRLSELDRLQDRMQRNILRARYGLRALDDQQAREAITAPAAIGAGQPGGGSDRYLSTAFTFTPEAIGLILDNLSTHTNGQEESPEASQIETFQLQVVCASIEKQVIKDGLQKVTADDLPDFSTVFEDYYLDRIGDLPEEERLAARRLIEEGLVFEEEEQRITLLEGQIRKTYGLSLESLQRLESTHLVRREPGAHGGFTYELSHDTLVAPVLQAKRRRLEIERQRAIEEERRKSEVERDALLRQAEQERLRAEAEQGLRVKAEEAERRARRQTRTAIFISIVTIALAILAGFSYYRAESHKLEAETNLFKYREEESQKKELEARQLLREGDAFYRAKEYQFALQWYQKARTIDPDNTEIQNKIENVQLILSK